MIPIRVLIVDDEPLARESLRLLLARRSEATVAGECRNGLEAVAAIAELRPDLVFLDVHMPGLDGFEVIREVGAEAMPAVVFVTAYEQFAVRAFETQALDYLLKPYAPERFHASLDRVLATLRRREAEDMAAALKRLLAVMQDDGRQPASAYAARLPAQRGKAMIFIDVAELEWIEACDDYVKLHLADGAYLQKETLKALEVRLDPAHFARVHKSAIVRIDKIKALRPLFKGDLEAEMAGGDRVKVSRRRKRALLESDAFRYGQR